MKTHSSRLIKRTRQAGFSLFEMLLVVAVIGVLSAIVVSSFSQGKRDVVVETVNRRNAQAFATIATCAQISGANPVIDTNVLATMQRIVVGVTPTSGPMSGKTLRISGMNSNDLAGAAYYLRIANGQLLYMADEPMKTY